MDEGKITESEKRVQPGAEVPADVYDDFKSTVTDVYGNLRGNVGTALEDAMRLYIDEYGDVDGDPYSVSNADIFAKLRDIGDAVSGDGEHAHTRRHVAEGKTETERNFEEIVANLEGIVDRRGDSEVTPSDIKKAVYDAGFSDDRTVDKYRDMMESRGAILPNPVDIDPADDDPAKYVTTATKFALICENNDSIKPEHVDVWLGELEESGALTEAEYRDALPEAFRKGRQLKIDDVGSGSSDEASVGGSV